MYEGGVSLGLLPLLQLGQEAPLLGQERLRAEKLAQTNVPGFTAVVVLNVPKKD